MTRLPLPPGAKRRLGLVALPLTVLALLVLPGCGGDCDDCYYYPPEPYVGDVYVDNLTDLGAFPEFVVGFYLAPAGSGTFTGNLLPGDLAPAATQFVGTYGEGFWDAEADMEFGDLVTWFDVFVPAYDDTFFEVY